MKNGMNSRCPRRARFAWAGLALALLPLWVLGGCLEANTLGDEPPDEVQVDSPPHWNNGMQELMTLKCGVCHQIPRPKTAPDETPDELDFTVLHGSGIVTGDDDGGAVQGAADALSDVQEQVQMGEMPKEFATPLTDQERRAILAWDGS